MLIRCILTEMFFEIKGLRFKVIYLMTDHTLSTTFKRNIFLTKILGTAPLKKFSILT